MTTQDILASIAEYILHNYDIEPDATLQGLMDQLNQSEEASK